MYKKIKGYYPEIIDYFPEYQENPDYLPSKKFMWDIFSTKDSSMANKFISYSLKKRNLKDFEGERTVEVSEDVLNQLHSANYFSKKKGKALFMLSASKELGAIKRKRKREIREFDPYNKEEEKKEPSSKRQKKNDEGNQKITEWLIKKTPNKNKKENKEKQDRNEQENSETDAMNIDMDSLRKNNPFIKKISENVSILMKI